MGDSANNLTCVVHRMQGTGTSDYKLGRHFGSSNIDTLSPTAAQQRQFYAFRLACAWGDNTGLDTLGVSIWGTWYTDNIVTPSASQTGETNRDCLRDMMRSLTNSQ